MSEKFYHTKESVDMYLSMAEGYDGSFLIDKLKAHLPENSTVLEIGSGPGKDVVLLSRYYQVTGSDYSLEFLNRLKAQFKDNAFLHLNAANLETDKTFDAIYSNKVLHHLTDEELEHSINRQYELLHADSIICHSFWKGEGEEEYEGMFVNNHTVEELTTLLTPHFDILEISVYKEMEEEDSILVIARKRKATS